MDIVLTLIKSTFNMIDSYLACNNVAAKQVTDHRIGVDDWINEIMSGKLI